MNNNFEKILKEQNFKIEEIKDIFNDKYIKNATDNISSLMYNINCENNYAFVPIDFNNYELLEQYNIIPRKFNYKNSKGVIITSNNDLKFIITVPHFIHLPLNYFLTKLRDYLSNYFDDCRIDYNDIMINNKKICGSAFCKINNMDIFMFQITFTDRVELIKKICTKSIKDVGFIDSSILSQETLLNEIISWIK